MIEITSFKNWLNSIKEKGKIIYHFFDLWNHDYENYKFYSIFSIALNEYMMLTNTLNSYLENNKKKKERTRKRAIRACIPLIL